MKNNPFMMINEIHTYASLLLKYFNVGVEERLREFDVKISGLQYGLLRMLMAGNLTISELSQRWGWEHPLWCARLTHSNKRDWSNGEATRRTAAVIPSV